MTSYKEGRPSVLSRDRLEQWALSLLPDPWDCPFDIGASFRSDIRQLGWASGPLWAVFPLIAGGIDPGDSRISPYVEYIRMALTPGNSYSFDDPTPSTRQIVFEQTVYGYGLLCLGDRLLELLDAPQRKRLVAWLNASNEIELPWGNWFISRLFVNCALRACGLAYSEDRIVSDASAVESMYAGAGWYEDGTPFKRDPYTASTFHLLAMLLEHYIPDNPIRQVTHRARCFARDYTYWFDSQGRAIPFGRGLTYRFAASSFWASAALLGDEVQPLAQTRYLFDSCVLWWMKHLEIQKPLSVGYGYPGAPVREDYSTSGAAYWAFKAFVVLSLPADDPFWSVVPQAPVRESRVVQYQPSCIIQAGEKHSYMLSAQQYCSPSIEGHLSKYGKLCYSTAFGWNGSAYGTGIGNFALDSALALSVSGTDVYTSRGRIEAARVEERSAYSVWSLGSVARVETWLVPIDEFRHARVHHIESTLPLDTYEGGFPVFGWNRKFDREELVDGAVKLSRDPDAPSGLADNCGQVCGIYDVTACAPELEQALVWAGLGELWDQFKEEWTPREPVTVSQNPETNIYSRELNAVPALKSPSRKSALYLGCIVYGDPGTTA